MLTSALSEKAGDVPVKEVVNTSQAGGYSDENSYEISKKIGGRGG